MNKMELKINGMVCGGCENRVKSALSSINGVENVEADHNTGKVIINSKENLDFEEIKEKITDIGFEIIEE